MVSGVRDLEKTSRLAGPASVECKRALRSEEIGQRSGPVPYRASLSFVLCPSHGGFRVEVKDDFPNTRLAEGVYKGDILDDDILDRDDEWMVDELATELAPREYEDAIARRGKAELRPKRPGRGQRPGLLTGRWRKGGRTVVRWWPLLALEVAAVNQYLMVLVPFGRVIILDRLMALRYRTSLPRPATPVKKTRGLLTVGIAAPG
ncbi:hypothetical protein BDV97DRAFT_412475 [Delphinella strobiligena]|nr:hypothetical protein BDV97DRAFT_412475 [Delphinella strobiligena]